MRAARSGGALSRRRIVRGLTVRMLRAPAKSFEVGEEGGTGMASPNARYFTTGARRAERAAWVMMAAGAIITLAGVAVLPEEVPVHWGVGGQPDRYGSPATYLLLPGILVFCNAIMSFVVHFLDPDTWSKPGDLREEDKPRWWQTSVSVVVGCEAALGGWLLLDSLLTVAQLSDLMLPSIAMLVVAMTAAIASPLVEWRRYIRDRG